MRKIAIILFIAILGLYSVTAQQPSRSDLEKRKSNLLKEIEATQKHLEATKKSKNASLSELKALKAKLNARQKLISNINRELENIDGAINKTYSDIQNLNLQLEEQKKHYAQTIRYAYKHRESENILAFLFSADDFSDALRRMQYLKRYREFRKDESEKIQITQAKLSQKVNTLNTQKNEKGQLLANEEQQKNKIQEETNETNKVIKQLKGKESQLLAQIKKDKLASQKLDNAIRDMIKKEIELARKKAEEEAKRIADEEARKANLMVNQPSKPKDNNVVSNNTSGTSTPTNKTTISQPNTANSPTNNSSNAVTTKPTTASKPSYKLSLTPEVQLISNRFSANQGKLPWPVEKGFVSGEYGTHPHPLYSSVNIQNHGIDITTSPKAPVRAVFEGTVSKVANIDGYMIMINHGEYFTVYSKLSTISVKVGDKVSGKQVIGTAGKSDEGEDLMNFQVWKITGSNFGTVDPSNWIAK